jgi:hypothetical protein
MIITCLDRAFLIMKSVWINRQICTKKSYLRSFALVGKHMCLQVLEELATVRVSAPSLLLRLLATEIPVFAAIR